MDRLAHESSPKNCSDVLLSCIGLLPVAAKPAKRPARATKSGIRRKVAASAWIVKTENTSHEFASCRQIPKWLEIALEMIDPIPGMLIRRS
jgi:hypothetical protein